MVDFKKAIKIGTENAESLVPDAKNFVLEGVLLSNDNKLYEVTLSYDLQGISPLELGNKSADKTTSGLMQLASLMSRRRGYKVFLVDSASGQFKGFKNSKDR
jgi:hypothetical protein